MLMVVPIGALDLRLSCMSYGQSDLTTVLVADMIFKAIHFNAWNILCFWKFMTTFDDLSPKLEIN